MQNKLFNNENTNNKAFIVGKIKGEARKTHQIEGEWFYELITEVDRRSQVPDLIPVTIPERLVESKDIDLADGNLLAVKGEFRSYNRQEEEKSKLILYFFAKDTMNEEEREEFVSDKDNVNQITLTGFICDKPVYRKTPFGREICDALVAVNRGKFNRSDYLPCIFWGRNAQYISKQQVGTKLHIEGRIQSREYTKCFDDGRKEVRTAYEISCRSVKAERDSSSTSIDIEPMQAM